MTNLISRKEALENKVFASFIAAWQERFDPRKDEPEMDDEGDYYDSEIDKVRFFTQAEIDEYNSNMLNRYLKLKDDIESIDHEYYADLKYNLPFADIFTYATKIGKTLQKLSNDLGNDLIFILDYSVPWLSQKNEYQPAKEALDYLRGIGVKDDYVGGFKLSGDALAKFAANLFWIVRCNADLPYCWFSTDRHDFVGSICQYGNIHLHTYSEEMNEHLQSFARTNSLIEIERCIEGFEEDEGIDGREINI